MSPARTSGYLWTTCHILKFQGNFAFFLCLVFWAHKQANMTHTTPKQCNQHALIYSFSPIKVIINSVFRLQMQPGTLCIIECRAECIRSSSLTNIQLSVNLPCLGCKYLDFILSAGLDGEVTLLRISKKDSFNYKRLAKQEGKQCKTFTLFSMETGSLYFLGCSVRLSV